MCSAMHTDWVDISGVTVHPHDASGQAVKKKHCTCVCVTNQPYRLMTNACMLSKKMDGECTYIYIYIYHTGLIANAHMYKNI